jgi:sulfate adenylyltransferase subunit 2
MSATTPTTPVRAGLSTLQALESEGIHILREAVATARKPVILFSGGKDSVVVLHLATKAFWPGRVPIELLHVDTGHNFDEVIAFRDATVEINVRKTMSPSHQAG